jgi:hypothetical protein
VGHFAAHFFLKIITSNGMIFLAVNNKPCSSKTFAGT